MGRHRKFRTAVEQQALEQLGRERALAYYYANKARILARMEGQRRQQGMKKQPRTREEKLDRVLVCRECGQDIRTPTLLLKGQTRCSRCKKRRRSLDLKARGLTSKGKAYVVRGPKMLPIARRHAKRFREYKAGLCCVRCGFGKGFPVCLDFHHRDPSLKAFSISVRAPDVSLEVLLIEIAKCDVLCANCHRLVHDIQ